MAAVSYRFEATNHSRMRIVLHFSDRLVCDISAMNVSF